MDRDHLKQMPDGTEKRYKALNGAVYQHFENVKKEQALKAEVAAIEGQLKTIDGLISSGNKASAAKGAALAEQLVTTIKEKYPSNDAAIAGARLTLANAKLAAGDIAGAKADLQDIANTAKDQATKDRAQLLQARVALKENQAEKAVGMLRGLSTSGATPELQRAAKDLIISIETGLIENVEEKARLEGERLRNIMEEKRPGYSWKYFTVVELVTGYPDELKEKHQGKLDHLTAVSRGAAHLRIAMAKKGMTLAELQKMSVDELAKLPNVGSESATMMKAALDNIDIKQIARGKLQDNFSWQNNTWYVDASYLDTELDKAGQWIGRQVRKARAIDEDLKGSDSLTKRIVGYTSGAILDAVSASNQFIKEKIKNASDFYNDPERKDTWYATLGRAGTFGADILTMPFTMPATVADYKATDSQRSQAIAGTLIMAGTMGVIKAGGPAFKSLAGEGASKIAASRVGQWVATTEFGQLVGRTAQKLGEKAVKVEARFEGTAVAKGMDKVKAGLGKLNPEIRIGGPKAAKTVDEAVDEILKVHESPAQLRASVTGKHIAAQREQIAKIEKDLQYFGLQHKFTDDEIRRIVIGKRIYKEHYNPHVPKTPGIQQGDFEKQLAQFKGPVLEDPEKYWHRRVNNLRAGETKPNLAWMGDRDLRRFYFNVKPENAAGLADHLANELNRLGMQFEFKTPLNVANFTRADAGVLYVQTNNYEAVKRVVEDYARKHPKAFVEGYPAFTKPIGKGVAVADQPIQAGLPAAAEGLHSFGSARSDIIAEAIMQAPANVTKAEMKQLVRERLKHYGIDPDRPWLIQGARVDDLSPMPRPSSGSVKTLPAIGIVTRLLIGDDVGKAENTTGTAE